MIPSTSIGRAGANAGTDGVSTLSRTKRSGGPSFDQSLEYVIGTSGADQQGYAVGNAVQTRNIRWQPVGSGAHGDRGGMQWPGSTSLATHDRQVDAMASSLAGGEVKSVKTMVTEIQPADTQPTGTQQKSPPLTSGSAALSTGANAASGTMTPQEQGTSAPQHLKADNYGYGTPGGYHFDSVPSTLDPGSMAFLLAWLGGTVDGQSVRQEQQTYLETYRQRYPDGAPGVKSYITATTNYLTGTS